MVKILRGREKLNVQKDLEFNKMFSSSWRHSIRSLDKKKPYKDVRHWEENGEHTSLSDHESEFSYSDGY